MIRKRAVRLLQGAAVLLAGGLLLIRSKTVIEGVRIGICLCIESVIPSLFLFMVLAEFFSLSGWGSALFCPFRVLARLYGVPKSAAPIILLSMLGGYPVGAKMTANAVAAGQISKKTAEKLLCSCVNCSPSFLIAAVGVGIFRSAAIGAILYGCQMAAAILTGFLARMILGSEREETMSAPQLLPASEAFVKAVQHAGRGMGNICFFVVVFSVLSAFLADFPGGAVLSGLCEVSVGCGSLAGAPFRQALILSSVYTAFGGFCVWMQVAVFVSAQQISMRQFVLFRGPYVCFSLSFTLLLSRIVHLAADAYAPESPSVGTIGSSGAAGAVLLVMLCLMLLISDKSCDTINPVRNWFHRRENR